MQRISELRAFSDYLWTSGGLFSICSVAFYQKKERSKVRSFARRVSIFSRSISSWVALFYWNKVKKQNSKTENLWAAVINSGNVEVARPHPKAPTLINSSRTADIPHNCDTNVKTLLQLLKIGQRNIFNRLNPAV